MKLRQIRRWKLASIVDEGRIEIRIIFETIYRNKPIVHEPIITEPLKKPLPPSEVVCTVWAFSEITASKCGALCYSQDLSHRRELNSQPIAYEAIALPVLPNPSLHVISLHVLWEIQRPFLQERDLCWATVAWLEFCKQNLISIARKNEFQSMPKIFLLLLHN